VRTKKIPSAQKASPVGDAPGQVEASFTLVGPRPSQRSLKVFGMNLTTVSGKMLQQVTDMVEIDVVYT